MLVCLEKVLGYSVCCVNNHISIILKGSFDVVMFHVAATVSDVQ